MTLYLFEGVDRAGKTTRFREKLAEPRGRRLIGHVFAAPPKGQARLLLDEMLYVYGEARLNAGVDFALDRGHISWFAYEHMLRGMTWSEATRKLHNFEELHADLDLRLLHVTADIDTILTRDDGQSTWTPGGRAALEREAYVFERLVRESRWSA